jgi:hypothetical protein
MFHQIIKQTKNIINYWIPTLQWWIRIGVSINFCIFPSLVIFLNFDGSNRLKFKFYEIYKNILIAIELEKVIQVYIKAMSNLFKLVFLHLFCALHAKLHNMILSNLCVLQKGFKINVSHLSSPKFERSTFSIKCMSTNH